MWVLCVQIKWFLLFLYSCPSNRSKRTFFSSFKWKLKSNVQCTYTTGTHRTKTLFEESKNIFFSCSIRGKLHCFCIVFLCAYGLIRFGLLLLCMLFALSRKQRDKPKNAICFGLLCVKMRLNEMCVRVWFFLFWFAFMSFRFYFAAILNKWAHTLSKAAIHT